VYRLTHAGGREHPTQAGLDQRDVPSPLPLPTDCTALITYAEEYHYDKAGNLGSLAHTMSLPAGAQTFTRPYSYHGLSNRPQKPPVQGADSFYPPNDRGCMRAMAHLDQMAWSHRDELIAATRTRRGNGPSAEAFPAISNPLFFAYDLRGRRVRKVAESGG